MCPSLSSRSLPRAPFPASVSLQLPSSCVPRPPLLRLWPCPSHSALSFAALCTSVVVPASFFCWFWLLAFPHHHPLNVILVYVLSLYFLFPVSLLLTASLKLLYTYRVPQPLILIPLCSSPPSSPHFSFSFAVPPLLSSPLLRACVGVGVFASHFCLL